MNTRNLKARQFQYYLANRFGGVMSIEGEGEGAGTGDNTGGNTGGTTNAGGTQDNAGETIDPAAFWAEPKPAAAGSPGSPGSADSGAAGGGQTGDNTSQEFTNRIGKLNFGDTFTPEIAKQVAEGDMTGVNKQIAGQMRQATQEGLVLSAQLMQLHGDHLMTKVAQLIDSRLGTRDNTASLQESFPTYTDAGMKPVIDGMFNQAMKHAGGDRTKAIAMTRDMLKYVGKTGAGDLGITTPPGGPGDDFGASSTNSKSLVDELLGRS